MQIIGNVFSNYDYIFLKLKDNEKYLESFIAFINNIGYFDNNEVTFLLAIINDGF